MRTYVINISTCTKKDDAYDEVCTNLYPIIIKTYDENSLREHLIKLKDKIKQTLKSKYLYDHAKFYIRSLDEKEFTWNIKDIIKLEY